jgi:hypothetical protein
VADQEKEKSPEELGEAVGRKIEALFGGFFGEDATQLLEVEETFKKDAGSPPVEAPAPKTSPHTDTIELTSPVPIEESDRASAQGPSQDQKQPFEDLAELIEALILNLEWEVTPEVVTEVADRFKEMDVYFPGETRARNVLSMNYRVLQRFRNPDGSSHPSLMKMLQDSLTVLKLIHSSPGNRQSIDSLIAGITNIYKLISAATASAAAPPAAKPAAPVLKAVPPAPKPVAAVPKAAPVAAKSTAPSPKPSHPAHKPEAPIGAGPKPALKPVPPAEPAGRNSQRSSAAQETKAAQPPKLFMERVEAAVNSLEEMGQRLSRIVGVLRQQGEGSGDELTTDTLERFFGPTSDQTAISLGESGGDLYKSLIKKEGSAIHALEEVSQRFSRILGVFRQGGDMSSEEIIRRLGTLEHLLSERLGQVSTLHKQLSAIPVSSDTPGDRSQNNASHEGLLTLLWAGTPLAIPSSLVTALFPINKAQSEQLQDKPSIVLGGRPVQRLPLKRPPKADKANEPIPLWLVHVTVGQKDYFLLAERSLGYRRTPDGVDVTRQARVNLGETSFAILNQSSFR